MEEKNEREITIKFDFDWFDVVCAAIIFGNILSIFLPSRYDYD